MIHDRAADIKPKAMQIETKALSPLLLINRVHQKTGYDFDDKDA